MSKFICTRCGWSGKLKKCKVCKIEVCFVCKNKIEFIGIHDDSKGDEYYKPTEFQCIDHMFKNSPIHDHKSEYENENMVTDTM